MTGTIQMDKFEINTEEFKELQFPIEVKQIYIGKFLADVSYAHLRTKPIEVTLCDIIILLGTPLNPDWDLKALLIAEQSKIFIIQKVLGLLDSFHSKSSTEKEKISKGQFKVNQLLLDIIRNIKVEVKNVHIRFEDGLNGLDAERPCQYALGLKFDSLLISPGVITSQDKAPENETSSLWSNILNLGSHEENNTCVTKSIQVVNLSMYFCDDEMMEQQKDILKLLYWEVGKNSVHRSTLLEPLNIDLDLQTFGNENTLTTFGSIHVKLNISPIKLNLNTEHYRYMICTLEGIDRFDKQMLYKRSRPTIKPQVSNGEPLTGKWKPWWKYAIKCVLFDLNDPSTGSSWNKTLNIILIALQYTSIRRMIKPYITRNKFQGTNGEIYHRYRETFQGETCVGDYCERSHFCGGVVKGVTKFGHGIVDGIYGLVKNPLEAVVHPLEGAYELAKETTLGAAHTVVDAVKSAEETIRGQELQEQIRNAKELWLRQLAIESCLRPAVAAHLRHLADSQLHEHQTQNRKKTRKHNHSEGFLTISLAFAKGFPVSSTPYCKIKIGQKGKSYTGSVIHRQVKEQKVDQENIFPFFQTFEFQLTGSVNEDQVYLQFYDSNILLDTLLGTTLLPIQELTDYKTEGIAMKREIMDIDNHSFGEIELTTCFQHKSSDHATITSHDKLAQLYAQYYKKEEHQMFSRYENKEEKVFAQFLTMKVICEGFFFSFSYTKQQDSVTELKECLRLELDSLQLKASMDIVNSKIESIICAHRIQVLHSEEPASNLKTLLRCPSSSCSNDSNLLVLKVLWKDDGKNSLQASLNLEELEILVNIPRLVQLFHRSIALPELTKLHNIFQSPFYNYIGRKTVTICNQQTIEALKHFEMGIGILLQTRKMLITIPDNYTDKQNDSKPFLQIEIPPLTADLTLNQNGLLINCSECKINLPQSLRELVQSSLNMFSMIKHQWFQDAKSYGDSETVSRRRVLHLEHEVEQAELHLGQKRSQAREYIRNSTKHKISPKDAIYLKNVLGDGFSLKPKRIEKGSISGSQLLISQASLEASLGILLLQQGLTVLKHHHHALKPSWRVLWISDDTKTLFLAKQRTYYLPSKIALSPKKPTSKGINILSNISSISIGLGTPGLLHYGKEENSNQYLTLHLKDCPKQLSISMEFVTKESCRLIADTLEDLKAVSN